MNKYRKMHGCMVPRCDAVMCDRKRKKKCALRRYFLINYVERKRMLGSVETEKAKKEIRNFYGTKPRAQK